MTVQTSYSLTLDRAVPGLLADIGSNYVVGGKNSSGKAQWTITLPANPDDSAEYQFAVNGIVITSGTLDSSSTTAELMTALMAAADANTFLQAIATVEDTAADVITITARQTDFDLDVTQPTAGTTTADMTLAEVTVAGADIPFGVFVKHAGVSDGAFKIAPLSASGDIVLGATVHNHAQSVSPYAPAFSQDTAGGADDSGVPAGDMASVCRQGTMWIRAEEALAITDTLYVRYTATAANPIVGSLRNDADSSKAAALPTTCKLLEYDATTGLALISINL